MQQVSNWSHSETIFNKYLLNHDVCLGHRARCWGNRMKLCSSCSGHLNSSNPSSNKIFTKCHICFKILVDSRKRCFVTLFLFLHPTFSHAPVILVSLYSYHHNGCHLCLCTTSSVPFCASASPALTSLQILARLSLPPRRLHRSSFSVVRKSC